MINLVCHVLIDEVKLLRSGFPQARLAVEFVLKHLREYFVFSRIYVQNMLLRVLCCRAHLYIYCLVAMFSPGTYCA